MTVYICVCVVGVDEGDRLRRCRGTAKGRCIMGGDGGSCGSRWAPMEEAWLCVCVCASLKVFFVGGKEVYIKGYILSTKASLHHHHQHTGMIFFSIINVGVSVSVNANVRSSAGIVLIHTHG